jgi:hypothetical protein
LPKKPADSAFLGSVETKVFPEMSKPVEARGQSPEAAERDLMLAARHQ